MKVELCLKERMNVDHRIHRLLHHVPNRLEQKERMRVDHGTHQVSEILCSIGLFVFCIS